ncbi:hypothetical protein J2Z53_001165 [Clostridium moniliforme]|uniref:Uncharacterized protein n=1 Tax=Clostridium moniliforme TaxID=39489 RepID=A0ABS4F007_9CLOT|nr:hypothetical protein [Clostridium moniliforme]MBP1889584.1 hypothetical protein [Clostridium moniliforme]
MNSKKKSENKNILSQLDKLEYQIANEVNYYRKNENYDKRGDKSKV